MVLTAMLPAFEALGGAAAAGLLTVITALGTERIAAAAAAHKERLPLPTTLPAWVQHLQDPVAAHGCVALTGPDGEIFLLAACFDRPHGAHAMLLMIDPEECGAATHLALVDAQDMSEALAEVHRHARNDGIRFVEKPLSPAEFRWHAEIALDRRADHDRDESLDDELEESSTWVTTTTAPASTSSRRCCVPGCELCRCRRCRNRHTRNPSNRIKKPSCRCSRKWRPWRSEVHSGHRHHRSCHPSGKPGTARHRSCGCGWICAAPNHASGGASRFPILAQSSSAKFSVIRTTIDATPEP